MGSLRLSLKRNKAATLLFTVLCLHLILAPFYVSPSGLPQPSDVVLVLFMALALTRFRLFFPERLHLTLFFLAAFVLYTTTANTLWSIALDSNAMLIYPIYYAFNALAFTVYVSLASISLELRRSFIQVLLYGTTASVFLQLALLAFGIHGPSAQSRQALFFNNPNQLGYYSLLAASIFSLASESVQANRYLSLMFFAATLYLAGISLSKAALVAILVLMLIIHLRRPAWIIPSLLLAVVAYTLFIFSPATTTPVAATIRAAQQRLVSIGEQSDDSLEGRGYNRIKEFPQYWILGAGEGAFWRFASSTELHSSWGTIVFSYGMLGSALFLAFLTSILARSGFVGTLYFVPAFLYGLTHQGLRFTSVWLLLALLAVTEVNRHERSRLPIPMTSGTEAQNLRKKGDRDLQPIATRSARR